ncbi:MAG: cryptochrome/photolyase family protein [Candidatus Nanopelagicales bacterium]
MTGGAGAGRESAPTRCWLFGDQLGPHFTDAPDQPLLLVESRDVLRRRRFHRQKAHLVLSAMRHRAAEARAAGVDVRYVRADTYAEALAEVAEPLSVCAPTSRAADAFVRGLAGVAVLPARGFVVSREDFAAWAASRGGRRLLLEDFYRTVRSRTGVLMDGDEPCGGRWNFDADNRLPPPRGRTTLGAPEPWWPSEDDGVRFLGADGPRRFAVTRDEALAALERFATERLPLFGPYEDAIMAGDRTMAHSLLSVPLNLGLLDPYEVVGRAERAWRDGTAPLQSVEGFVRQLLGWREYVWHVYWWTPADYRDRNALDAREPVPAWWEDLDADAVTARCLSAALRDVREWGWTHHIPRLMVLGNYALQRGIDPAALTDWFHRAFVDGYDWVMVPNVVGMSQHADGGVMATKPYAAGGAYLSRMSDHCRGCAFDPRVRVGPDACPFTAGYWAFLHRNREALSGNHRMTQPLRGLDRLVDLDALLEQEVGRGLSPP